MKCNILQHQYIYYITVISETKFKSARSRKMSLEFYTPAVLHYNSNTNYIMVISAAELKI
jgi:hypothetical protein